MTPQEKFLAENPALAEALECLNEHPEVHAKNKFAHDVVAKFHRWGTLSDAQLNALVESLATDHGRVAETAEPKGDAPVGRHTVTGEVLALKTKTTSFGTKLKMLVKLRNNSRVWVTAPKVPVVKGEILTFTSTFEVSKTDKSFAFGNRTEYEGGGVMPTPHMPPAHTAPIAKATPTAPQPRRSVLEELLAELDELDLSA